MLDSRQFLGHKSPLAHHPPLLTCLSSLHPQRWSQWLHLVLLSYHGITSTFLLSHPSGEISATCTGSSGEQYNLQMTPWILRLVMAQSTTFHKNRTWLSDLCYYKDCHCDAIHFCCYLLDYFLVLFYAWFAVPVRTARTGRYVPVRQASGTRTACYRSGTVAVL